MKLVVSDKEKGKTYQKELKEESSSLFGKRLGEEFDADIVGLVGYKLKITGGSDKAGFPMRKEIEGSRKLRPYLSTQGVGFNPKRKGEKRRKMVRGNRIDDQIHQVNTIILVKGEKSIEELCPKEKKEE